jgi:hypothetical protein
MLTAELLKELPHLDVAKRNATSLSLEVGAETAHSIWRLMQRGLVYTS